MFTILAVLLLVPQAALHAALGLDRESYGVWDREGGRSVANFPYTRGQEYAEIWANIEPSRTNFNWAALDAALQFADSQNQKFIVQILPIGGASGSSMPPWMSSSVPFYTDSTYTYGDYLNANFQTYYQEMVQALATHLRTQVASNLQARIAFVRCDTGATGDEVPYASSQNASYVQSHYPQYYIADTSTNWLNFRLWAFEVYRHAFQDGPGPVIPILFQNIEQTGYPTEWNWVTNHVVGGFGGKYGGQVRGHNLTQAKEVSDAYRQYAAGGNLKIFSRNEMDQTWQDMPMFQTNLALCMYWVAVEQLHPGLSVWDVSGGCLDNNTNSGSYAFAFEFFNKWAAELDPPTAGGGFCIFHDGLDSSDTNRFPEAVYGSSNPNNTSRYTAICATNASHGARMDDLYAATVGQVYQRKNQIGFNDSGWQTVPGNYERFITQINPNGTSKGVWRIYGATNGVITPTSHPFDRFGRSFDHASGKDAMYFDIQDNLLTSPGQRVQLTVIYRDTGTGQFALRYDAAGNSQKTAFTVTKSNSLTWKTNSVVVTDGAFANRGPNGADLVLANLGTEDTIFHSLEIIKLADVNVGTVGQGTVSGRTDGTTYAPITGTFMERQRLELAVTPAVGWKFTGWSGDLSGTNTRPFLFPTKDSRVTANFACVGSAGGTSTDDFSSGTLTGGTGWSGGWTTTGTVAVMSGVAQVTGTASITRTLATPLWNGTLSFDWDLDKIATSRYGLAQVYDGSWHTVWSNNLAGSDSSTAANLAATNISLSAYGSISQISFSLNGAGGDLFWIDNVRVTAPAVTNTSPLFSSDPINKSSATSSGTYTGTLAGDASDPGGKPLSFSKVSGPAWLTVAANGTFSGTPLTTDVGLNSWQVRIDNGVGGSDDAILLINVSAAPANSPPVFTVKSMNFPTAGAGISYDNTLAGSATDMNPGNLLTYSKVSGPAWLNVASGGALSGTPSTADVGTNSWTLQVSDGLGGTDTATLKIVVLSAYTVWANQNLLTQGPNGDDDGDGNTNYFEFIAGLDPKNPSSVFAVKIARVPGQSNQAAISFKPIVAGRTYTVKSSDSLASGTWTPLSGSTSSDVGNERTVTDTGATGAKKFYLIEISYP